MPAPKAQVVTAAYVNSHGTIVFVADGQEVIIDGLNTNTVSQLARRLGLEMPRTATDIDRRAAIVQAVADGKRLSDRPAERVFGSTEDPTTEDPTTEDPAPTATTEPVARDNSDGLAAAREALGTLSAADIATLISDTVAAHLGKVRPIETHISVNSADPIVVKGRQHHVFERVLGYLADGSHVYLWGPAGSGKSTLGRRVAEALGLSFGAMALGPTPMASKLMGYMTPNNEYVRTPYRDAVEHGGVFLVDELDGSFPGTLVEAINEVAAASPGDVVAFPDGMVTVHEDFRLLGGGNTPMRGADGTYSARAGADGSTHTRFVFVHMPYDLALERDIVLAVMGDDAATDAWLSDVRRWREAVDTHGLNGYVISPREAIQGAKALARGADRDDVLTDCVFKGWNAEARRKVERV